VTLLVSGFDGAPPITELDGMEVWRTGGRYTFGLRAPRYYRRIQDRGFDLVIEDLNKVPVFSPRWAASPVVLLVHHLFGTTAFEEASLPLATATWLLERPLAGAYRGVPVEAVSESTAADLVRRGFDRTLIEVIPNGVDLATFSPDPSGHRFAEPTVLYLGRLKRYKRVDLIIRAIAKLVRGGVSLRAVIAGQGDQARALGELRDRLGLSGIIDMPGFVDDAEKVRLMQRAWIHVLTSPREGWGITNIEAAACGTPTIASDSPGLRDSVLAGESGLLVPHADVDALAAAIRLLVEDSMLRERLGRGARDFASRFTWDRTALRTEEHLEHVIASRTSPSGRGGRTGATHGIATPTTRE
jgi:glycosyltransferase involved in cell wall biosynthesis